MAFRSISAAVETSAWAKFWGLMFKSEITPLIFKFESEQYVPLHSFFVGAPIDVLFLDESKKVVEIKVNFEPYSFYHPKLKAKYVVELPAGNGKGIRIGDTIRFK